MKLIIVILSLGLSFNASADCISLEQAKSIATEELIKVQNQDQYLDKYYYGWEDAAENLHISVSCNGAFKFEHSFTED